MSNLIVPGGASSFADRVKSYASKRRAAKTSGLPLMTRAVFTPAQMQKLGREAKKVGGR